MQLLYILFKSRRVEAGLQLTLRLVFLVMSKFSVFVVKRIWQVLIFFFKELMNEDFVLVDTYLE